MTHRPPLRPLLRPPLRPLLRRSFLAILPPMLLPTSLLLSATTVRAHEYYTASFTIIHPWAEPTALGVKATAVYLRFENIVADDALIGANSEIAGRIELRSPANSVVKSIALPKGQDISLSPQSAHLMLIDLRAPLLGDRSYPLTLVFEKSGEMQTMLSMGEH